MNHGRAAVAATSSDAGRPPVPYVPAHVTVSLISVSIFLLGLRALMGDLRSPVILFLECLPFCLLGIGRQARGAPFLASLVVLFFCAWHWLSNLGAFCWSRAFRPCWPLWCIPQSNFRLCYYQIGDWYGWSFAVHKLILHINIADKQSTSS